MTAFKSKWDDWKPETAENSHTVSNVSSSSTHIQEKTEIDENLCRSELSPTQEAEHLARRKELWLTRIPNELRRESGTNSPTLTGRGNKGFAQDVEDKTGQDKREVNRKVSRGEKIAPDVLAALEGTPHDKGAALSFEKPSHTPMCRTDNTDSIPEIRDFSNDNIDARVSFGRLVEAYCKEHWPVPPNGYCGHCENPNPTMMLPDGVGVCDRDDYACLIGYGTARKMFGAALAAKDGNRMPEGWRAD